MKGRLKRLLNESNVFSIGKICFFSLGLNKRFEHKIIYYFIKGLINK